MASTVPSIYQESEGEQAIPAWQGWAGKTCEVFVELSYLRQESKGVKTIPGLQWIHYQSLLMAWLILRAQVYLIEDSHLHERMDCVRCCRPVKWNFHSWEQEGCWVKDPSFGMWSQFYQMDTQVALKKPQFPVRSMEIVNGINCVAVVRVKFRIRVETVLIVLGTHLSVQ